ncbi:bacteriohemerythrin [Methylococcus sp. EFPC2]|uniref:bacteriohemerythrin n=1 Tax=Methylococcus sp. EFPC2 TaxID=2812648 RepID=UPI0019677333|nr:hemerythrin family protein [Methylococcus sp. EFPC2]QSA97064.1 hemerythrin family protein [Methylococcus sp. EFPC2]
MSTLEHAGLLQVGHDLIDQDHAEFLDLLGRLDAESDAEFPALFAQLCSHTEQHFERENQLMRQSAFPAEAEHKGEHQRVIGEFRQFKSRVDRGLIPFARCFVRENLPGWLKLHVSTMDSALVAHLKAQSER